MACSGSWRTTACPPLIRAPDSRTTRQRIIRFPIVRSVRDSAIAVYTNRHRHRELLPYAITVLMAIADFFLYVIIFHKNPFSTFLTAGYEKETEDGYEKSVKVAGNPGWEKWNSSSKGGELNAFVNKRFVVQIEGRHLDDTKVLYQLADAMQLGKLASLK